MIESSVLIIFIIFTSSKFLLYILLHFSHKYTVIWFFLLLYFHCFKIFVRKYFFELTSCKSAVGYHLLHKSWRYCCKCYLGALIFNNNKKILSKFVDNLEQHIQIYVLKWSEFSPAHKCITIKDNIFFLNKVWKKFKSVNVF